MHKMTETLEFNLPTMWLIGNTEKNPVLAAVFLATCLFTHKRLTSIWFLTFYYTSERLVIHSICSRFAIVEQYGLLDKYIKRGDWTNLDVGLASTPRLSTGIGIEAGIVFM